MRDPLVNNVIPTFLKLGFLYCSQNVVTVFVEIASKRVLIEEN